MRILIFFLLSFFLFACSSQNEKEALGDAALAYAKESLYSEITAPLGAGPKALQFVKYLEINTVWKVTDVSITTTDRLRVVVTLKYDSFHRALLDDLVREAKSHEGKTWNDTLDEIASKPPYKGVISSYRSRYVYQIKVYYSQLAGSLQPIKMEIE